MRWCIPPFIDNGKLTSDQKKFNTAHSKTRQVVERSFALLFGRWRRLQYVDMKRTEAIPATVMACCMMHNICLMFREDNRTEYLTEGLGHAINSSPEYRSPNRQTTTTGKAIRDIMVE